MDRVPGRRRTPGFYVRVEMDDPGFGLPGQMLDGPWRSPDAARLRAAEIRVSKSREEADLTIVRVEDDGVTVTPLDDDPGQAAGGA